MGPLPSRNRIYFVEFSDLRVTAVVLFFSGEAGYEATGQSAGTCDACDVGSDPLRAAPISWIYLHGAGEPDLPFTLLRAYTLHRKTSRGFV